MCSNKAVFLSHHVECGAALSAKGAVFLVPVSGSKQYSYGAAYGSWHAGASFLKRGICFLVLRGDNYMLTSRFAPALSLKRL
jgi:hypothetical protein